MVGVVAGSLRVGARSRLGGLLTGPPLIGGLGQRATVAWGLGVVVVLSAVAAVLATRLRAASQ